MLLKDEKEFVEKRKELRLARVLPGKPWVRISSD